MNPNALRPSLLLLCLAALLGCGTDAPESPDPGAESPRAAADPIPRPSEEADVLFTLRFEDAARHLVDVEAVYPLGPQADGLELMMAVWTPGSYLVREYARHVEGLTATDSAGRPLGVEKLAKNRWRVASPASPEPASGGSVTVSYRIYAREMSVRTNFVDADLAVLNGAPTFIVPVGGESLSHEVRFVLPEGWTESATALDSLGEHRYFSPDFDTLVDSPVLLGPLARFPFEVDGVPHELVQAGDYSLWDHEKVVEDVAVLTEEQIDFWRQVPYDRYLFLNVITEAGGGLEHADSTLMLTGRFRAGDPKTYRRWLSLVSHELFHTWNVKRLRPAALGPFDYESENYTRSLWIAEGTTSYFGPLLLRRAGLYTDEQYLEVLSRAIENLQKTPGRRVRSVADSSFDAWIKGYRPDENTGNTAVSYYGKGSLVSWLLDVEIRRRTTDRGSLDDVLRLAYERFSGERGFTPDDFRAVVAEVAGEPFDDFFDRFVDGVEELDYGPALDHLGLRFKKTEEEENDVEAGYLGFVAAEDEQNLVVATVPRGTPAWDAGLNVDDEILAVGDYRVDAESWQERLKHYPPGTESDLWISRRGRLRRLPVTFGVAPRDPVALEIDPEADSQARRRRTAWLDGRS